jgi:hypothetical protein
MSQEEDIYDWMAKQKFPLDKAGVQKVSTAKLAELRAVGIKFVSVLGSNGAGDCEACLAIKGEKIDIDFATPLPLPGCDKKNCMCCYIATE